MEYILVGILQFFSSWLRVLEIKYTYEEKIIETIVVNGLMVGFWLFSTWFGVAGLVNHDYWMIPVYLVPNLIGKYLALKKRKNLGILSPKYRKRKKRKNI